MEISGKHGIIFVFVILLWSLSLAQQYAVNVYDEPWANERLQVKTVFIDLESKQIINSVVIAENGFLLNKKPLNITVNNSPLLISAVLQGCICKNALPGQRQTAIAVIDPTTNQMVYNYADSSLELVEFSQYQDNSLFLYGEMNGHRRTTIHGDYELNGNYGFVMRNQHPLDYIPGRFIDPESGRSLKRFNSINRLYRYYTEDERIVFKMDHRNRHMVDSLTLNNGPNRSIICASIDTLIYIFHQNYEYYGKFIQKTRQDDWIQSHLLIYNIADFSLIDSVAIPDYPEGDYIIADFDVADIVGDFVVYYYAQPGGLEDYTPAMLFIFDTRTNEATWLRVGWR